MMIIKILMYSFIFFICSAIGTLIARRYTSRVKELKEFKTALNIFKTKIKFTYEPIPEIFKEISKSIDSNIGIVFMNASKNMKTMTAGRGWEEALEVKDLNIAAEDREILRGLGKLLGKTDIEGQISQIEVTSSFLDEQILKAEEEKNKSEKMYKSLGMIVGIAIVIILM